MLVAVYFASDFEALTELLSNLDPRETMNVMSLTANHYLVTYTSPNMVGVAADPGIRGVMLLSQARTPT